MYKYILIGTAAIAGTYAFSRTLLCKYILCKIATVYNRDVVYSAGHLLSGFDFNAAYRRKFVKFTNEDEAHFGMKYKTGLNVDVQPLGAHGMFFLADSTQTIADYLPILKYCIKARYQRSVTIPDSAYVYVVGDGIFKTNKFILGERDEFNL
jgi:hypothetical protein